MDGVGVASQGCVCLACDFEIEYDRSVFLFKGEFRELGVLAYAGVDVSELAFGCSRMFIHFDVGMGVESRSLGKERCEDGTM